MRLRAATIVLALLIPAAAHAEKPDPTTAWNVVSYYFNGADEGPLLMDSKLCLDVDTEKGSETRWECVKPAGDSVPKGTTVSAWTKWLVPKGGDYDDIMIQFVHEGMVRTTKDVKLTESLRMRTFRSDKLSKAGAWEIRILRGGEPVKKYTITVTE